MDVHAAGRWRARQLLRACGARRRPAESRREARSQTGDGGDELDQEEDGVPWNKTVRGSFLVAAYRRPDFRVDVTLTGDVA